MTNGKWGELMPDDIQWLKDGMDRLEQSLKEGMDRLQQQFDAANVALNNKLDGLPCLSHLTELSGVKQQVKNHLEGHKQGWTKTSVLITALSALIALTSVIIIVVSKAK